MRGLGLRNGCDTDSAEQFKLTLIMKPILTLLTALPFSTAVNRPTD